MAFLFRGPDRLKMKKGVAVLKALMARDLIALNINKRSTAISTRTLVFDDPGGSTHPLYTAAQTVLSRLQDQLTATR